jgi:hypothetical protein
MPHTGVQLNPTMAVSILGMLAACYSRLMRFDAAYYRAFRIANTLEP